MNRTWRFAATSFCVLLAASAAFAQPQQQATPAPPADALSRADFIEAADNVLADMSKLLSLPVLQPLKKSIRSRDEIRAFLLRSMKEEKDTAKDYANQRALEAFGLLPKDYPLEQKLLELLTEQIAGLYDPKGREFYIADWTEPDEQFVIMAHELTHALQDQHFGVEKWEEAAQPNDDAVLARDAVLEGSATVAMIDYLLRDSGQSSRDMPNLDPSLLLGDLNESPQLAAAPLVIQDEILFPYTAGFGFMQRVLKAWNGWPDLHKLFENPPASTQQILHPDLYLRGVLPQVVTLAPVLKAIPRGWKKLDENVIGELSLHILLKQFLGVNRADRLAPGWAGDRYAVYEQRTGGPTLLVVRMRLANDDAASRFFGGYSDLLEKKHARRTAQLRRPNLYSFTTPGGGVFLRCAGSECLIAEGTTREVFEAMTDSIGWPRSPLADPAAPARNGDIVAAPPAADPAIASFAESAAGL